MKNSKLFFIISVAAFVILAGGNIIALEQSFSHDLKGYYNITSSQAQKIVMNNSKAATYYNTNYYMPDWRVNRTTIVNENVPDMYGRFITPKEDVWKVEIMERTCACNDIKPIYVIEGYVSTDTGEVFNISTKKILETSYNASTCASTACH